MRQINRNLPVFDLRTQTEQIDQRLFIERLLTRLSTIFGLVALLLTSVGLYGLLSYEVTRRTREIGIRMAIGAQAAQVQRAVLSKIVVTVFIGLAIGVPLAFATTRLITSLLYKVSAFDIDDLCRCDPDLSRSRGPRGVLASTTRFASRSDDCPALRMTGVLLR